MTNELDGQMSLFDPDLWSGKTSPGRSAQEAAKTSEPCSKKRQGSQTRAPLFLDLRKENGVPQEQSWQMGGALLGVYSTRSFGEFPNAAAESHLSQILEDNPRPKYFLSAKACQGILRRAERRGKELPEILREALIQQEQRESESLLHSTSRKTL